MSEAGEQSVWDRPPDNTAAVPLPPPPPGTAPAPPTGGGGGASKAVESFARRLFDTSFRRFITPEIVRLLFVLAVIGASLVALLLLVVGFAAFGRGGWVLVLMAPVAWVLGVVYARVFLELAIVLFRIEVNTRPPE